jgi:hypothetical protein
VVTRRLNLSLGEELVRRVRQHTIGAVGLSDTEVVENALTAFLTLSESKTTAIPVGQGLPAQSPEPHPKRDGRGCAGL